ncbi:hypothetical protein CPB85DRAFT_1452943 [Mucidula mucida]|nr:hypothetical protein CPB85DRAFT_1452943 [Mucidula mucida]
MNPIVAVLPAALMQFVLVLNPWPQGRLSSACPGFVMKRLVMVSAENTFLGRVEGLPCYPDTHDITPDWGHGDGMGVWELAKGV